MGRPPGLFQPIIPRGPVYDPINVIQGNTTIRRFPLRVTNNSYALTGCIALTIGEGFRDVI